MNTIKAVLPVLAVFAVVMFGCQAEQETTDVAPNPFLTSASLEEARLAAADGDKNILLDFYTDW